MSEKFNTYINKIEVDFWKNLCIKEGILQIYRKGDEFVKVGTIGKYVGYIKSGTLKYVAYSPNKTSHVVGLEFEGEFVADFPFSLYGNKSIVSIIAESDCEIFCIPVADVKQMMDKDLNIRDIVMHSTEALFSTVYSRYVTLYTQTPQQRYNDMISRHPDLFALFSLKDIASYLNVTPTHLSRLRKNI